MFASGSDINVNGSSVFLNNSAHRGGETYTEHIFIAGKSSEPFKSSCHRDLQELLIVASQTQVFHCAPIRWFYFDHSTTERLAMTAEK